MAAAEAREAMEEAIRESMFSKTRNPRVIRKCEDQNKRVIDQKGG